MHTQKQNLHEFGFYSLAPRPRQMETGSGEFNFMDRPILAIVHTNPLSLLFSARQLKQAVQRAFDVGVEIRAGDAVPGDLTGIRMTIAPSQNLPNQGYQLSIRPDGISIHGQDAAGIFYAVQTLIQLIENSRIAQRPTLPALEITDWPDFPARGVMLDISRDKVPSMETLFRLVDLLAGLKINQLQLYTEHTFAYLQHPQVWEKASPITGEEILLLDQYCAERFIELVPNQNSFGHMHRWFEHPRYAPLGELYKVEIDNWWGKGSFSLCPEDPGSFALIQSLYAELLPHFNSRMFNVGCDETFDLGLGRSKTACEQRGKGRVYLDFLMKIYQEVKAHGRTMQFWGDIILQHPELVPELPRDCIALEWGYEAEHPFAEHAAQFAAAGIPFYVCPGTSSWNTIAGRTDNALGNLLSAAQHGLKNGARGYLITDWGDNGHWQQLPISYLGYLAGAAYSWCCEGNRELDVQAALSRLIFQDPTECLGKAAYALGNVYQSIGILTGNASVLFLIMQEPLEKLRASGQTIEMTAIQNTLKAIQDAADLVSEARPQSSDHALLEREFELTVRLLRHAVQRGRLAVSPGSVSAAALKHDLDDIIQEYRSLWLARNRPGGLTESLARFEHTLSDYQVEN